MGRREGGKAEAISGTNVTHLVRPLFLLLDPMLVDGHVFRVVFLGRRLHEWSRAFLERLGLVVADLEGGW